MNPMKKLLLFLLLPLSLLGATRVDPLMVFTDGRVANYTNLFNANSNRIWEVLGATNTISSKLNITNGTAVRLSGSLTNVTANGITLTTHGISTAVNRTAGDLQDLSSFGVFDATVPSRVRVLRDDNGYILGSGRWFNKAPTDSRVSDGITIILPIDVPSDASPGRWVLEGYEQ